jgi:beta-galactosidase
MKSPSESRPSSLGDQGLPWSGALHYFRTLRDDWGRCLDAACELGLTAVESYVPWSVHEVESGRFDFEGAPGEDGRLDLAAFARECASRKLGLILRPGPHINAELTDFGFPERLLDIPDCRARGPGGGPAFFPFFPRMFPIPSYASRRFRDETRAWIDGVAQVLRPLLAPAGPVVALQVDNEQAMFFRLGAYDLDYHPDSLRDFRAFLRTRYADDLARLKSAHAQEYGSFDAVEPPRAFFPSGGFPPAAAPANANGLARHLDWVAFKTEYMLDALRAVQSMMREAGLATVPLFHNFPPVDPPLSPYARAEGFLSCAGGDFYHQRSEYRLARRRALFLAGSTERPYASELGCGMMLAWPPIGLTDQLTTTLNLLMHGVRTGNFYMLVERERWYGSPIRRDGERRADRFDLYRKLIAAIHDTGLPSLRRDARVGLLVPRTPERLAAVTSLCAPLTPILLGFAGMGHEETSWEDPLGFAGPIQIEGPRILRALETALSRAHVSYVLVDEDLPLERLLERQILIAPTFEIASPALLDRLEAFARADGRRLLLGPRRPSVDETLAPLPGPPALADAQWLDAELLADVDRLASRLAELCPRTDFAADEPDVDTSVFRDAESHARVVFVANGARSAIRAHLTLPSPGSLVDAMDDERITSDGDHIVVDLAPYGVRMFRWEG